MKRRDAFDAVIDDARAEVRGQIAAGGRVRDFAAMIARARAIDPDAVPAEAAAEVHAYARVVALRRRDDPEASAPAEADVGARRAGPRRARIAGVAAALLLGLGLVGAATLARREVATPESDAASLVSPAPGAQRAHLGGPTPARRGEGPDRAVAGGGSEMSEETGSIRHVEEDMSHRTDNKIDGEADAEAHAEAAAGEPDTPTPPPTRVTPSPGRSGAARVRVDLDLEGEAQARALAGSSWEAVDRAAREAWRRGELAEARALLGAIVAADTDASRVELAFGDLLVLARQAGDARGLQRARRDYLRRFPAGTYAEDARAGLCRDGGDPKCWRAYLDRWPDGAHAAEARRIVGD